MAVTLIHNPEVTLQIQPDPKLRRKKLVAFFPHILVLFYFIHSFLIESRSYSQSGSVSASLTFHNNEAEPDASEYQYEGDEEEKSPPAEIQEDEGEAAGFHEEPGYETESVLTLYLSRQENENEDPGSEVETEEMRDVTIHYIPASEPKNDRAKTAPARPLIEIEELRGSKQFVNLEAAAVAGSQLVQRPDGKFDVDSPEGQKNCKTFLQELEKLFASYKVPHAKRNYRDKFSQAYKVLYQEGELCYLTEILDSAQEGFPFLWVNSEKYIFSTNVLNSAKELFTSFGKIKHVLSNTYNRICEENALADVKQIVTELRFNLFNFDKLWARFERVF